jgi:hypothetical protein
VLSGGDAWLVRPLFLCSHCTVTFAPGVVVAALAGAYHDGHTDCLFTAHKSQNLTILGEGQG